jgi:hypothetical protein
MTCSAGQQTLYPRSLLHSDRNELVRSRDPARDAVSRLLCMALSLLTCMGTVCCIAWLAWLGSRFRVPGKAMRARDKDNAGLSSHMTREDGSAFGLAASRGMGMCGIMELMRICDARHAMQDSTLMFGCSASCGVHDMLRRLWLE